MTITSPIALLGLPLAVAPVVIYLLLKRRRTEVAWGAGYLLRLTLTEQRKQSLWKQLVVLAVRVMILALAALLLAGLLRDNPDPPRAVPALPEHPVHRVILADNSLSLSVIENGASRFTPVEKAVRALMMQQRVGDRITVLPLLPTGSADDAESQGEPVEPPYYTLDGSATRRDVDRLMENLRLVEGDISLAGPLTHAFAALARTPRAAAEIYVFTDLPRELADEIGELDWVAPAVRERNIRLAVINLAGQHDEGTHVTLDRLSLGNDSVLLGVPQTAYVDAANRTDRETVAELVLSVDDQETLRRTVTFQANERRWIPLPITFTRPGPAALAVHTGQSRLPSHARRHAGAIVRGRLDIWLVLDPSDAARDHLPDDEFLLRVLRQQPAGAIQLAVTAATINDITRPIPAHVDLIIIMAPGYALPAARQPLTDFVRRGGGVVLAATSAMQISTYNDNWADLLPGGLHGPARGQIDPDIFSLLQVDRYPDRDPRFADLPTERGGDFADVRFYNHIYVEPDKDAKVIFRLASGDPLLVERRHARGSFLLYTSTFGIDWASLPVRQSFVPLILRLIQAAQQGSVLPRNVAPGTQVTLPWPDAGAVRILRPDGAAERLEPVKWRDDHFVFTTAPNQRGIYRIEPADEQLSADQPHHDIFTVVSPPPEGDLRPLADADRDRLAKALGGDIHPGWTAAVTALGAAGRHLALWPWILATLLALYLFECVFVRLL